jgi:hypothetical protein
MGSRTIYRTLSSKMTPIQTVVSLVGGRWALDPPGRDTTFQTSRADAVLYRWLGTASFKSDIAQEQSPNVD